MRYVFLVNPVAGKGKAVETVSRMLQKIKDVNFKMLITKSGDDTKELARSEAAKGDEVVVFGCGGEGTCFQALNGIIDYPNASLGIVPCGSANDFLKLFESKSPFLDLQSQLEGTLTPIDIVKCDDEYCFNGCSAGMDAMVAHDMGINKNWKFVSGSMAYKLSIVKNFLSKKIGLPLRVNIDGGAVNTDDYLFAVCANGSAYGGGYTPAPKASPEDGKLDFALVKKMPRLKIPGFLKFYEKGEYEHFDCASTGNCFVMDIESDKPFPVNRDGEIIMKTKVHFELVRRAVNLLVPKGAVKKYEETLNFAKST